MNENKKKYIKEAPNGKNKELYFRAIHNKIGIYHFKWSQLSHSDILASSSLKKKEKGAYIAPIS